MTIITPHIIMTIITPHIIMTIITPHIIMTIIILVLETRCEAFCCKHFQNN